VQERQIDVSAQVERVKRKTRPWKSIIALVLAIAAAVISHVARRKSHALFSAPDLTYEIVAAGTAVLFLIFASMATYGLARQAGQLLEPRVGIAYAAIVRYAVLIVGAFTTLLITLVLFGVPVSQLVLGGALTTIVVSIAAQQALGNVFAGLVLMLARPFKVGDAIRLRAGALGGPVDGRVTDIGITYVRVHTGVGVLSIPNSQVLNAVVGPIPPDNGTGAQGPAVGDGKPGTSGPPGPPQPSPPGPA